MDGSTLLLGFLCGLFVSLIILYIYTEPKPEEPKPVMDDQEWFKMKFIEDENRRSKMKVLEDAWFESHPCVHRKNECVCTGTLGYSYKHETVPVCRYPSPEGGYKWERDMLTKCSKCNVRKEPDKVE